MTHGGGQPIVAGVVSGLVALVSIREQLEQAKESMLVSSSPPWLIYGLCISSCILDPVLFVFQSWHSSVMSSKVKSASQDTLSPSACSMVTVFHRSNRSPSWDIFPLAYKTKQNRKTMIFKIQWFPSYIIFKNQNPNNSTVSYPDVCAFKRIMLLEVHIAHRIQTNKRTKKKKPRDFKSVRFTLQYFFEEMSFP